MKVMCIDASYNGKVILSKELLDHLKKNNYKNIALFASVQFVKQIESVKEQLKDYHTITAKASRTHVEGQLLGCDVYESNLHIKEEPDCFLYIGDGFFHPKALLFAQKEKENFKEILMFDPIGKTLKLFNKKDNEKVMRRLKGNLLKFISAKNIGFIATVKPGQSFLQLKEKLKEKYPDKNIYIFLTDNISENALECFPFIEVWVNSACPRIGFDDALNMSKAILNITDAMNAIEVAQRINF